MLKAYRIERAVPACLKPLRPEPFIRGVHRCGDHFGLPSIDSALRLGRETAERILERVPPRLILQRFEQVAKPESLAYCSLMSKGIHWVRNDQRLSDNPPCPRPCRMRRSSWFMRSMTEYGSPAGSVRTVQVHSLTDPLTPSDKESSL